MPRPARVAHREMLPNRTTARAARRSQVAARGPEKTPDQVPYRRPAELARVMAELAGVAAHRRRAVPSLRPAAAQAHLPTAEPREMQEAPVRSPRKSAKATVNAVR